MTKEKLERKAQRMFGDSPSLFEHRIMPKSGEFVHWWATPWAIISNATSSTIRKIENELLIASSMDMNDFWDREFGKLCHYSKFGSKYCYEYITNDRPMRRHKHRMRLTDRIFAKRFETALEDYLIHYYSIDGLNKECDDLGERVIFTEFEKGGQPRV